MMIPIIGLMVISVSVFCYYIFGSLPIIWLVSAVNFCWCVSRWCYVAECTLCLYSL